MDPVSRFHAYTDSDRSRRRERIVPTRSNSFSVRPNGPFPLYLDDTFAIARARESSPTSYYGDSSSIRTDESKDEASPRMPKVPEDAIIGLSPSRETVIPLATQFHLALFQRAEY